jgi:hypothetical protein
MLSKKLILRPGVSTKHPLNRKFESANIKKLNKKEMIMFQNNFIAKIKDGVIEYYDKNNKIIYFFNFSLDILTCSSEDIIVSRLFNILHIEDIDYDSIKIKLTSYFFKRNDREMSGGLIKARLDRETLREDIETVMQSHFIFLYEINTEKNSYIIQKEG